MAVSKKRKSKGGKKRGSLISQSDLVTIRKELCGLQVLGHDDMATLGYCFLAPVKGRLTYLISMPLNNKMFLGSLPVLAKWTNWVEEDMYVGVVSEFLGQHPDLKEYSTKLVEWGKLCEKKVKQTYKFMPSINKELVGAANDVITPVNTNMEEIDLTNKIQKGFDELCSILKDCEDSAINNIELSIRG